MAKRTKLLLVTTMVCGVALICVGFAVHAAMALIYPIYRVGPVDKQLEQNHDKRALKRIFQSVDFLENQHSKALTSGIPIVILL